MLSQRGRELRRREVLGDDKAVQGSCKAAGSLPSAKHRVRQQPRWHLRILRHAPGLSRHHGAACAGWLLHEACTQQFLSVGIHPLARNAPLAVDSTSAVWVAACRIQAASCRTELQIDAPLFGPVWIVTSIICGQSDRGTTFLLLHFSEENWALSSPA